MWLLLKSWSFWLKRNLSRLLHFFSTQRRLRWFEHVQRRPPEALLRSGVLERVDNVKRGRGRHKLTWDELVKRDLKDWSISKEIALDRSTWRLAINVPKPWPLFLLGFICSLPQLAWEKRLSACSAAQNWLGWIGWGSCWWSQAMSSAQHPSSPASGCSPAEQAICCYISLMMLHIFTFQDIGSTEFEADNAEIERLEVRASALRKVLACKWSSNLVYATVFLLEVWLPRWSYLLSESCLLWGGPDLIRQIFMFVILWNPFSVACFAIHAIFL